MKDLLRKRAQSRLETATNLANMYAQTEVAMQEADREARQKLVCDWVGMYVCRVCVGHAVI